MQKISPSRINALMSLAISLGLRPIPSMLTTGRILQQKRGRPKPGYKWTSGVYIPAGESRNVDPTPVRNPEIAAHVNMMHEKWVAAKDARHAPVV